MNKREDLTVAGLIHDLNNVFQTLLGVASRLEEDPASLPLAAAIQRSVERGIHLTASLQNGASPPMPVERIFENARSFIQDFQIASGHHEVRIQAEMDPGIELTSPWEWERVLVNLFLNSLQAMPSGGTIYFTAVRKPSSIVITVADEGTGIAPEVSKHLFEPHVSTRGSSGLGLHIVHSVVHASEGTVRAANRKGAPGAEFIITLPAKPTKTKRAHA
ncbi:MAG: HAMP domain-containing sensor histidine kinase [Acidobacteriota bacterium]